MTDASISGTAHPYVNAVRAMGGPFELVLEFGRTDNAPGAVPDVTTGVVMSWEHAKVVRDSLDQLVRGFEERTGFAIPDVLPPVQITDGEE